MLPSAIDLRAVALAAEALTGHHDFRSFTSTQVPRRDPNPNPAPNLNPTPNPNPGPSPSPSPSPNQATLLIVSHDRGFLDDVVTDVVQLRGRNLTSFRGDITSYVKNVDEQKREQKRRRAPHHHSAGPKPDPDPRP